MFDFASEFLYNDKELTMTVSSYFDFLSPKYITRDFYDSYPSGELNDLGNIIFLRTYSRFVPELKRRESWKEVCLRVTEFSIDLASKFIPFEKLVEDAKELFSHMMDLKAIPAGRTLWTGGTAQSDSDPSSNWNCCFCSIDSISSFSEIMYWLMLGSGTGFSVEKEAIDNLPYFYLGNKKVSFVEYKDTKAGVEHTLLELIVGEKLQVSILNKDYLISSTEDSDYYLIKQIDSLLAKEDKTGSITIYVGDSKVGWCTALKIYLELLTLDRDLYITFNFREVRPAGERIKVFGGRSSGPIPLKNFLESIYDIINEKKEYKPVKLTSVQVLDILNWMGKVIVSGGARRTSELCLTTSDDIGIIEAKRDLWTDPAKESVRSIRTMSNNSIMFEDKPSLDYLYELMEVIKTNGDPGFWNRKNSRKLATSPVEGVNPCFTGDMRLLTKEGYQAFETLEGKQVEVIDRNGNISVGKVWNSGERECIRLKLSTRETIACTPDHVFLTNDGEEVEAQYLKGKRLVPPLFKKHMTSKYVGYGYIADNAAFKFFNDEPNKLYIDVDDICDKDNEVLNLFNDVGAKYQEGIVIDNLDEVEAIKRIGFLKEELGDKTLNPFYYDLSKEDKAAFLRGRFSAKGFILNKGVILYKSLSYKLVTELKEALLNDFGIESFVIQNFPRRPCAAKALYSGDYNYDLVIKSHKAKVIFYNEINFIQNCKTEALANIILAKAPIVRTIKEIGSHKVYDFTEPNTNWGVVEGFIVHNCGEAALGNKQSCNLTTQNLTKFIYLKDDQTYIDWEGLATSTKIITRIGVRQTLCTQWHPEWDKAQKRDRLLGVSFTGLGDVIAECNLDNSKVKEIMTFIKAVSVAEADRYCDELGINHSTRVTLVKPEGTISILLGVSSGLHDPYANYYFRRVRFSKFDPLCIALRDVGFIPCPENGQGNDLDAEECDTWVYTFPVKTNAEKRAIDIPAIEQLERYKVIQTNYCDRGHNASSTITVADNEWKAVAEWLYENWDDVIGVTLLSRFDPVEGGQSAYPQMPLEPCSEEQYKELKASMPKFNEEELIELIRKYEFTVEEQEIKEDACSTGSCPIR